MSETALTIHVEVNPTEDSEKVKTAIKNLFVVTLIELRAQQKGQLIVANGTGKEGLTKFYNLIRQERIIAAARRVLANGTSGKSVLLCLNKQAAYMNRISFCEPIGESPLGSIKVEIISDNPKALIDWLAPKLNRKY